VALYKGRDSLGGGVTVPCEGRAERTGRRQRRNGRNSNKIARSAGKRLPPQSSKASALRRRPWVTKSKRQIKSAKALPRGARHLCRYIWSGFASNRGAQLVFRLDIYGRRRTWFFKLGLPRNSGKITAFGALGHGNYHVALFGGQYRLRGP
jgi:hypothetical protein